MDKWAGDKIEEVHEWLRAVSFGMAVDYLRKPPDALEVVICKKHKKRFSHNVRTSQ